MTRASPVLAIVGHIDISPAVLKHRFTIEALANALMFDSDNDVHHQVVGTGNTRRCELYGWAGSVDSHADNTGWMYAVALNEGETQLFAWEGDCIEPSSVAVPAGAVVRLWDHCLHWTEDTGPRVAAFVGSFDEPCDEMAVQILRDGIAALASGAYYGAPRVLAGFRALLPDECLASDDAMTKLDTMLLKDARQQKRLIVTCAKCRRPAVKAGSHWPYHQDGSRCRVHLGTDSQPKPARFSVLPTQTPPATLAQPQENPCN